MKKSPIPQYTDGDAVVFIGSTDLPDHKKQSLVKACRFVCIEKGRNQPEQLTAFLTDRLLLIGRSGVVYTSGLPPAIARLRAQGPLYPTMIGCDAFLAIPAKHQAAESRAVSIVPVMFEELEHIRITSRGGGL